MRRRVWLAVVAGVGTLAPAGCVPDIGAEAAAKKVKAEGERADAAERKLKAATAPKPTVEVEVRDGKTVTVPKDVRREDVFEPGTSPTQADQLPAYVKARASSEQVRADVRAIWAKAGEAAARVAQARAEQKLVIQAAQEVKALVAGVREDGDALKRLTGNLRSNLDQCETHYDWLAMDLRKEAARSLPEFRDTLLTLARAAEAARDSMPRKRVLCERYLAQLDAQAVWFAGAEKTLGQIAATYAVLTAGGLPLTSNETAEAVGRLSAQFLAVLGEFTAQVAAAADPNRLSDRPGAPAPVDAPKTPATGRRADTAAAPDPGIDYPGEPAPTTRPASAVGDPEPTPPAPVTLQSLGYEPLPKLEPPLHMLAGVYWTKCNDCDQQHPYRQGVWKIDLAGIDRVEAGRAQAKEEADRLRALTKARAEAAAAHHAARAAWNARRIGRANMAAWAAGRRPPTDDPEPPQPDPLTPHDLGYHPLPALQPPLHKLARTKPYYGYDGPYACGDCGKRHPDALHVPLTQHVGSARLEAGEAQANEEAVREQALTKAQAAATAAHQAAKAAWDARRTGRANLLAWTTGRHPLGCRRTPGGAS